MAEYIEYHPLKFWLDPASIAEIVAHIQSYLVANPINSTTEIETIIHDYLISHPELIGGVDSVNGQTGEVVLTADNISGGENVTIKDVLDSLQDQIDDIVASIPSDYQQLINDVSDLKSALYDEQIGIHELLAGDIIQGSYSQSGAVTTNSARIRTKGFIPVYKGEHIRFEPGTNSQQMFYGKYDNGKHFIADGTWMNGGILDITWDGYTILVFRKANNADITPSEYDATTEFVSQNYKNFQTLSNRVENDVSDINTNISALANGLDITYTVTGTGYKEIQCLLVNGSTYTFVNDTGASCNLLLIKNDGTTTVISTQVKPNTSVTFLVSGNDYVGVRFYANAVGTVRLTGGVFLGSLKAEIDVISTITDYDLNDGYINQSGGISSAGESTKEVYTSKIPCGLNFVFSLSLTYQSANTMWCAYALYDASGAFLERITLDNGISRLSHTYSATITNQAAKFIAFTWRTHSDCSEVIATPECVSVLSLKINDIDSRLSTVENGSQVSAVSVNSINHRGYSTIAPENTLPAYKLSRKMGFDTAETDVAFTSDGVAVLLHDGTINRTARNADGSVITTQIDISSITYEQVLAYDFGIWKGQEYAGTKIPTFTQFIQLCKRIGLSAYVELKPTGTTEARVHGLMDTVKNCGMSDYVTWISFYPNLLTFVKNYDNSARIGLVTESVTSDTLSTVTGLQTDENEVFIDSDVYNDTVVNLCANARIPLEVWTVNNQTTMENLNPYITGATSDSLIFGRVLYNKYIN